MLSRNTIDKLKGLETILEISLIDELVTQNIVNEILERTVEMNAESILDHTEIHHIFSTVKSIIFEEEQFAKQVLGNCVAMLDHINNTQKLLNALNK